MTPELPAHHFRHEHGRLVSLLSRRFAALPIELCEDAAQAALLRAVETWPRAGVPDEPRAWLYRVAHRHVVDAVRLRTRRATVPLDEGTESAEAGAAASPADESGEPAYLATELDLPSRPELERRVPSILHMLYLLFNEGYSSAKPETVIRRELCDEAIRLALVLVEHPIGSVPETDALLALMCFHAARLDARLDGTAGLLLMREQDRARWDRAIVEHCLAPTFDETRWEEIARLYTMLDRVAPSPLHRLHRAIAIAEWKGPDAGIAALEMADPPPWLLDHYLWHATWSELQQRVGNGVRALAHLEHAIEAAPTLAERALLERRRRALETGAAGAHGPRR